MQKEKHQTDEYIQYKYRCCDCQKYFESHCIKYSTTGGLRQSLNIYIFLQDVGLPHDCYKVFSNWTPSSIEASVNGKIQSRGSIGNITGTLCLDIAAYAQRHSNVFWLLTLPCYCDYITVMSFNMSTTLHWYILTTAAGAWEILHDGVQSYYFPVVLAWDQSHSRGGLRKYNTNIPTKQLPQHFYLIHNHIFFTTSRTHKNMGVEYFLLTCLQNFVGSKDRLGLLGQLYGLVLPMLKLQQMYHFSRDFIKDPGKSAKHHMLPHMEICYNSWFLIHNCKSIR